MPRVEQTCAITKSILPVIRVTSLKRLDLPLLWVAGIDSMQGYHEKMVRR